VISDSSTARASAGVHDNHAELRDTGALAQLAICNLFTGVVSCTHKQQRGRKAFAREDVGAARCYF